MPHRREFLTMSAGLLAGASGLGDSVGALAAQRRGATAASFPPPCPRGLIVVELSGGNDGWNTVVPLDSRCYREARPTLALPRSEIVPLDSQTGMHAALAPLLSMWDSGELALERSVGPTSGRPSHATAVEAWRRTLVGAGRATEPRCVSVGHFAEALVDGVDKIAGSNDLVTVGVSLPGFDTHSRQAESHGHLLATLAEGLVACRAACEKMGLWDEVRVVVVSEFGRSLAENSFGGTDHGAAGLAIVAGPDVNSSRILPNIDDEGLAGGDFRAVCSVDAFAARWCGRPHD